MIQDFTNILKNRIDIPSYEKNQSKCLLFILKYKDIN